MSHALAFRFEVFCDGNRESEMTLGALLLVDIAKGMYLTRERTGNRPGNRPSNRWVAIPPDLGIGQKFGQ